MGVGAIGVTYGSGHAAVKVPAPGVSVGSSAGTIVTFGTGDFVGRTDGVGRAVGDDSGSAAPDAQAARNVAQAISARSAAAGRGGIGIV